MRHKSVATLAAFAITAMALAGCSTAAKSNANDPVLSSAATKACEEAVASAANLADFSQFQHHLSGDLNPSFTDTGTVHMRLAGQFNGTKNFSCSGRVDPQTGMANAVMTGTLTG